MPKRIVTFGEIMLRLKSPGRERLLQTPLLEATFGGAESNVAVALSQFGDDASFVSRVPAGPLGDAAIGELLRFGVDTRDIARAPGRMGIYFLEAGADQRAGTVVYDRAGSSMAMVRPGDIDWNAVLAGADWFHLSGITPAISESAAEMALEAVQVARARMITVSCDVNHRAKLWNYGLPAHEVMRPIVRMVQVLIANEDDCRNALGVDLARDEAEWPSTSQRHDRHKRVAHALFEAFPHLQTHVMTLREGHSADRNGWSACLYDGLAMLRSREYELTNIVDRVGAGDAFTAGLIHGLLAFGEDARALEFATAAGCLKHSIPGDLFRGNAREVEQLLTGEPGGRIQR